MAKHTATIVRIAEGGVAYADDPAMEELAGFSFGRIVGYRGETAKELDLRPGKKVTIEYDTEDRIISVSLTAS